MLALCLTVAVISGLGEPRPVDAVASFGRFAWHALISSIGAASLLLVAFSLVWQLCSGVTEAREV